MAYCGSPVVLTLTLGAATLDVMDERNGFRVTSLDLAFPGVRELLSPSPSRNGSWDSTQFFDVRVVTITGSLVPVPYASRSHALDQLAPFLDPGARPYMTFQVDGDASPRMIGLRASALSAPYTNPQISAFSVSWKTPDPIAYSTVQTRVQGVASGTSAAATSLGNFRTWPAFRIHGPCQNPVVNVTPAATYPAVSSFGMVLTTIAAGNYIDADMYFHKVTDQAGADQYALVDFANTTWPALMPGANNIGFTTTSPGVGCALDVTWRDGWL